MANEERRAAGWHLQREVPIALILALILQLIAGVTFINKLESRQALTEQHLNILEGQIKTQRDQQALRDQRQDDVAALADKAVLDRLDRLDAKLDRLIERRRAP